MKPTKERLFVGFITAHLWVYSVYGYIAHTLPRVIGVVVGVFL